MERFELIKTAITDVVTEYEMFIENILGVGEKNPLGHEIREYTIKVPYTEFIEQKESLLKQIERLRLIIMEAIPTAYEIHSKYLLDIEEAIYNLPDKGNIEDPLQIKLGLNILEERILTAIKLGDVDKLLSESYDFDKMSQKMFKDALKKISKSEKALIIFDTLMRYGGRDKPMGIFEIADMLGKSPEWVKSGLKVIREEAPEVLRIVMAGNREYKYYVPDIYKRYYVV